MIKYIKPQEVTAIICRTALGGALHMFNSPLKYAVVGDSVRIVGAPDSSLVDKEFVVVSMSGTSTVDPGMEFEDCILDFGVEERLKDNF